MCSWFFVSSILTFSLYSAKTYLKKNYKRMAYQVIHLWTETTFLPIWQFSHKKQAIWNRFANKKVLDTFNCFDIHIMQVRKVRSFLLKPHFNKILIVAITTRSKSNIVSTKASRLRADIIISIKEKSMGIAVLYFLNLRVDKYE